MSLNIPKELNSLMQAFYNQPIECKTVVGDDFYKDSELNDITKLNMSYLYVFKSLDDEKKLCNYEQISKNPQNFSRCIARERFLEINSARIENKLLFYFETENIVTNGNYDKVNDLSEKRIFVRGDVSSSIRGIKKVIDMGGSPICSLDELEILYRWYNVYETKRPMNEITLGELRENFDSYKENFGTLFAKTVIKGVSTVGDYSHEFFPYEENAELPLLISKAVKIDTDNLGNLEFRAFVVDNSVISISRYLDYEKHSIPTNVTYFVDNLVETMKFKNFPGSYVVDVMIYNGGEIDVVEFNGINGSGRYVQNTI